MSPVALWTDRLPALRPLPSRFLLAIVALLAIAPIYGWRPLDSALFATLATTLLLWAHSWPRKTPRKLLTKAVPIDPDERVVVVEIRQQGSLIGWDLGILWFEEGGFGFVGETVTFILPRSLLQLDESHGPFGFDTPKVAFSIFDVELNIIPRGPEIPAQMTVARIERLPERATQDTVLPPRGLHPDLLRRAASVRRRTTALWLILALNTVANLIVLLPRSTTFGPVEFALILLNLAGLLILVADGGLVPQVARGT